ncbi:MAG: preprotein translocase subunit SecG [Candidatus Omnitrophica bacterium]|nr:preprotein translocase subunit SecG [Candidatus Omnitrophota bacterium]
MYIFLIGLHVMACLVLILVVLLQAGRGGGFSEMAGGGQPQSIFGTQTNTFMTRATEVCAVIFIITSLSLGIVSTQRGKSLMERRRIAAVPPPAPAPAAAVPAASQPETASGPAAPAPADASSK